MEMLSFSISSEMQIKREKRQSRFPVAPFKGTHPWHSNLNSAKAHFYFPSVLTHAISND